MIMPNPTLVLPLQSIWHIIQMSSMCVGTVLLIENTLSELYNMQDDCKLIHKVK